MEKKGLSKKQLLLFIASIVLLLLVFLFFSFRTKQKGTAPKTTSAERMINPDKLYINTSPKDISDITFVTLSQTRFHITYPKTWSSYTYSLAGGEVAYVFKPGGFRQTTAYPILQINAKPQSQQTDADAKTEKDLLQSMYHFEEHTIPLDGQVVTELVGNEAIQKNNPLIEHALLFTRGNYFYEIRYSYQGTKINQINETIFAKILDMLVFNSYQ